MAPDVALIPVDSPVTTIVLTNSPMQVAQGSGWPMRTAAGKPPCCFRPGGRP